MAKSPGRTSSTRMQRQSMDPGSPHKSKGARSQHSPSGSEISRGSSLKGIPRRRSRVSNATRTPSESGTSDRGSSASGFTRARSFKSRLSSARSMGSTEMADMRQEQFETLGPLGMIYVYAREFLVWAKTHPEALSNTSQAMCSLFYMFSVPYQVAFTDPTIVRPAVPNHTSWKAPRVNAAPARTRLVAEQLHSRRSVGRRESPLCTSSLGYDDGTASGMLCEAASAGDVPKVRMLLECGCNPSAADYDTRTCLHLGAASGNLQVAELLIKSGANSNIRDRWGGTPLMDAVRNGHTSVALKMRAAGCELSVDELEAARLLATAARDGDMPRVKLLLEIGLPATAGDYDLRTCMHVAAREGHKSIVAELVARADDVNKKDRWGTTALTEAKQAGHAHVVELLQSKGGV